MSFTNELSVIPTDERGKQLAVLQIRRDLEAQAIDPCVLKERFEAIIDIYEQIKPILCTTTS